MLIKSFNIPGNEAATTGLQAVNMSRLGRYIALAGKNGAGKSRLLEMLERYVATRTQVINEGANLTQQIDGLKRAILENAHPSAVPGWQSQLNEARQKLAIFERVIADKKTPFKALPFVPKGLVLEDPLKHSAISLSQRSTEANHARIEAYHLCCLPYIQKIQNRWWSVTHQNYSGDSASNEIAIEEYEKLNELVKALLGIPLGRTADDETTIFQKPLAEAGLSDGQKVILQLAVALHAQKGTLDNTVFILDELENHLHPSATIDLLKKLDLAAPNAQIWIATHSVPLLAYIASKDPMALWYMEDGKVTHSGKDPERVLKGLLGDEERIGQVHTFTGLPALLATTNYAVESLLPPKTAAAQKNDPQVHQISKLLETRFSSAALSVLDFGAGQGRLLEGIVSHLAGEAVAQKVSYMAFDECARDRETCCSVINEYFDPSEKRYFGSSEDFFAAKDDGCVDVVVMCNVFHEIPPSQWLSLFASNSLIMRALRADGFLLLVEDQRIPVGEKAHEHGFFVLDTPHLKTLFDIKENDIAEKLFIQDDCRQDGRLKAHLIAKSLLEKIKSESRTKAINELLRTSLDQVQKIRQQEASYSNGLLHGFWAQQLANAYMYNCENSN